MKCRYCGVEYSNKVLRIHEITCSKIEEKVDDEIVLEKCSKTDLMVLLMSETDADETLLKKMNKAELLDLAHELKD